MRFWFSKVATKDDARYLIRRCAALFSILATAQLGFAALILSSPEARALARVPPHAIFNFIAAGSVMAILAALLVLARSRTAAISLFAISALITATAPINNPDQYRPGALALGILAIGIAIRAIQATFTFQKRAAAASAAQARLYDVGKWKAVLKNDKQIAKLANNLQPLGDKWVDEFARSYLAIDDKKHVWHIVQKIITDARVEALRARARS
jgi:hypothetical protein